jgi:hypothetical protein
VNSKKKERLRSSADGGYPNSLSYVTIKSELRHGHLSSAACRDKAGTADCEGLRYTVTTSAMMQDEANVQPSTGARFSLTAPPHAHPNCRDLACDVVGQATQNLVVNVMYNISHNNGYSSARQAQRVGRCNFANRHFALVIARFQITTKSSFYLDNAS